MLKTTQGFTLLEVTIATFISSLVAGLLILIMVNNTTLQYLQSAKIAQGVSINEVLFKTKLALKEANAVSIGYPLVAPNYLSSSTTLILQLPTIDASNEIVGNSYDYMIFLLEGDKLKQKTFPNLLSKRKVTDAILAKNVASIKFDYLDSSGQVVSAGGASKVVVTVQTREKAGKDDVISIATGGAYLRNY